MKTSRIGYAVALFAGAAITLTACGGGGGGSTGRAPDRTLPTYVSSLDRSQATRPYYGSTASVVSAARLATNEPTNADSSGSIAVVGGVNQARMMTYITRGCTQQSCYPASLAARHGGAEIGHIRLRDGVSAPELLRYLRADANFRGGVIRRWGATPPVVRLI